MASFCCQTAIAGRARTHIPSGTDQPSLHAAGLPVGVPVNPADWSLSFVALEVREAGLCQVHIGRCLQGVAEVDAKS